MKILAATNRLERNGSAFYVKQAVESLLRKEKGSEMVLDAFNFSAQEADGSL